MEGYAIQFAPAYVRLRILVEPDAANRGLYVALVSEGFETSSYEQLEGMDSPRTRWREFKDVPEGEYAAVAVVERGRASRWTDRVPIRVMGWGR